MIIWLFHVITLQLPDVGSVDNFGHFFANWWDLLDLSQEKKLLGMVYICPIGSREGMNNFFF